MKLHNNYYFGGMGAVGIFLLRLVMGIAFMVHGWSKIQNPFGWMSGMPGAPPGFLQALAAVSEFGGGLALILGLLMPLACLGIMSTMFVASLTFIQKGAPFLSTSPQTKTYESAGFYFVVALMFFLVGPGSLALDAIIFRKQRPTLGEIGPLAKEMTPPLKGA